MLSQKDLKLIIYNLGIKVGVAPNLILSRLLDDRDIKAMLVSGVDENALESAVLAWKASGMPDYAHGKTETLEKEKRKQNKD